MAKQLHLRLTLDVRYDAGSTSAAELIDKLYALVDHGLNDCLITGESDATVAAYRCDVRRVTNDKVKGRATKEHKEIAAKAQAVAAKAQARARRQAKLPVPRDRAR